MHKPVIRVLVPRPVADALLPTRCETCRGTGRGGTLLDNPPFAPCVPCDGSGSLPPVLTWLVVEGEAVRFPSGLACGCKRGVHPWEPGEWCPTEPVKVPNRPPADLVRAIESGEHIGIEVECETCDGRGEVEVKPGLMFPSGPCGVPDTEVTADNAFEAGSGRVLVGSVRPTEVLPITNNSFEPEAKHIWWSGAMLLVTNGDPQYVARDVTAALSLYGDPGSLVGRYAIAVTDARREG